MFSTVLEEASYIRDNVAYNNMLNDKSIDELRYENSRVLREASIAMIGSYLGEHDSLTESFKVSDIRTMIEHLVESFKQLILKVVNQLMDRVFPYEKHLDAIIKKLKTSDYLHYSVSTRKNIKNIDTVIAKCKAASNELKSMQVDNILSTFTNASGVEKAVTAFKVANNTLLDGYVNTFKKYNSKSIGDIKEDLFGPVVIMDRIEITKFSQTLKDTMAFKKEFTTYSSEYESYLNKLSSGIKLAEKADFINGDSSSIIYRVLNAFSAYFNRNVNLIIALVTTTASVIMSTANNMATAKNNEGRSVYA